MTVTESRFLQFGYKILYSVCADPCSIMPLVSPNMVPLSQEVARSEKNAASKRDDLVEPFEPVVAAAAAWMAEFVARVDFDDEEEDDECFGYIKSEYASDFTLFGMTLIGLMLEEGLLKRK